ncbi:H-NS histone family protein [Stenotrophomonas sp.]|uniref:H-NS histone family protein n=1 Tax=Stenotrophomonas sp. TaxID=69392 RepID=UPI0028AD8D40|nr:H-NS histone family protein [Stenotrophomonas sp.]
MTIDLEKLNSRELTSLMKAAQKRKALLEKRPSVTTVRRKVLALLKASGYSIEELVGDGKVAAAPAPAKSVKRVKRTKLGKAPVKYRDPDNKRNTWSGRGSTPRWLLEKTARGRSVADYLIPGLAKPTARKAAPIGKRTVFKQA